MKNSTLTISIMVISSLISGCTTALKSKAPDGMMIRISMVSAESMDINWSAVFEEASVYTPAWKPADVKL